jgi:lipid-A-disaccharide synthase
MSSLLLVAGEASGDLHGARLLTELRRRYPGLSAFGLGGDELAAAGLDAVAHSGEVAVVGIVEVLKVLPRARRVFADLLAEVDRRRPDVAVLVDFPEFNLRLAKELKARGVPVVYYVSPQVWAWRRGRVHQIAQRVDRMLVLFPFEADFYRDAGVEVVHVGHPLVDEVPQLPHVWDQGPPQRFRLALLPGSRPSEVEALLPTMLAAAGRLAAGLDVSIFVQRAPTVPAAMVEEAVAASGLDIEVESSERFEHLASSHLALCASGTATLEVGLLGTPLIVLYRLRFWTYLLGLLLVRLPHISLVNLVLGREVVPELLQRGAHPERVAAEARALLTDAERIATMRRGLAELRQRLGEGGASRRAAEQVASLLGAATAEVPA